MDKTVIDAKHMTRTFNFEERVDVEKACTGGSPHDDWNDVSMTRTKWGVGHWMALASLTLELANLEL